MKPAIKQIVLYEDGEFELLPTDIGLGGRDKPNIERTWIISIPGCPSQLLEILQEGGELGLNVNRGEALRKALKLRPQHLIKYARRHGIKVVKVKDGYEATLLAYTPFIMAWEGDDITDVLWKILDTAWHVIHCDSRDECPNCIPNKQSDKITNGQ